MIPSHPLADIFPLLQGVEIADLAQDILQNGVRQRIDILDDKILDGRNRYRAAVAAGLISEHDAFEDHPAIFRYFSVGEDGDPLAYVISKNLKRRHLNESQRAYIAAKLAILPQGRPSDNPANLPVRQANAAAMLNVSERSVRSAAVVRDKAEPELRRAVEQGHLPVSSAAQAAKLNPDQQRQIAVQAEAGQANVVRTAIKKEARALREQRLGEKQMALPQQKFGVILSDPEWHDDVWSDETGMDRHAANHYPTTAADVIASREVPSISAADCVLFLWSTNQHLRIALSVMEAWGFTYKSNYCWGKDRISLGRWSRGKHELLLIGTQGSPPCPAPGTQWDSLIRSSKGEHSAKPECFLEMIEQYFPTLPKIELNRRGPARPGWKAWGNEAQQKDEGASEKESADKLMPSQQSDELNIPAFLLRAPKGRSRNALSDSGGEK
jgi:N6-adenosine-specific RNA methylase IME4